MKHQQLVDLLFPNIDTDKMQNTLHEMLSKQAGSSRWYGFLARCSAALLVAIGFSNIIHPSNTIISSPGNNSTYVDLSYYIDIGTNDPIANGLTNNAIFAAITYVSQFIYTHASAADKRCQELKRLYNEFLQTYNNFTSFTKENRYDKEFGKFGIVIANSFKAAEQRSGIDDILGRLSSDDAAECTLNMATAMCAFLMAIKEEQVQHSGSSKKLFNSSTIQLMMTSVEENFSKLIADKIKTTNAVQNITHLHRPNRIGITMPTKENFTQAIKNAFEKATKVIPEKTIIDTLTDKTEEFKNSEIVADNDSVEEKKTSKLVADALAAKSELTEVKKIPTRKPTRGTPLLVKVDEEVKDNKSDDIHIVKDDILYQNSAAYKNALQLSSTRVDNFKHFLNDAKDKFVSSKVVHELSKFITCIAATLSFGSLVASSTSITWYEKYFIAAGILLGGVISHHLGGVVSSNIRNSNELRGQLKAMVTNLETNGHLQKDGKLITESEGLRKIHEILSIATTVSKIDMNNPLSNANIATAFLSMAKVFIEGNEKDNDFSYEGKNNKLVTLIADKLKIQEKLDQKLLEKEVRYIVFKKREQQTPMQNWRTKVQNLASSPQMLEIV